MSFAIQTHNLTKRFPGPLRLGFFPSGKGGVLAVDGVTLDVERGEVFGLVGPNGAGKTTLVKLLSTLIVPTSGTARVNGHSLSAEERIKGSIGLVTTHEGSFYPRLSCRENLRFYAGLHNLSRAQAERRIDELVSLLNLAEFIDTRFDVCSTGTKHRLALARGLLNDPRLLFLDEPTRSLDPLAAARFRETVYGLAHREGHTVFLVTHNLDEAVDLCDRIGVMVHGCLRMAGAPQDVRQMIDARATCRLRIAGLTPQVREAIRAVVGVEELCERETVAGVTCLDVALQTRRGTASRVLRAIEGQGARVDGLDFEAASWDELFQQLPEAEPTSVYPEEAVPLHRPEAAGSRWARLARGLCKPLLFLRRDLRTEVRYRLSFLLQVLGIFLTSASFYFVSQLLGGNVAASRLAEYGGDYFSFVLIGIAFVGYQTVALHAFSKSLRTAQVTGTLEAMLATPTRLTTILLSSSLFQFAFTSLRIGVYLLLGALVFGAGLGQANTLSALVVLLLTILTLSGLGIFSACFTMAFKRGDPVNFLLNSVSTLLGGVYYPVQVLPAWLQLLAGFFPLTYALEGMRRALLVGDSVGDLAREVGVLAVFAVTLLPASLLAFRLAVRKAKVDGSLTQF